MYKYKKVFLFIITILYVIFTIYELIFYLLIDSNVYGLYYLIVSSLIIFLLIPIVYNYKRHYSKTRISKLIIVILIGIFSSVILETVVLNSMNYSDSSSIMINKIWWIKNVVKPLIYSALIAFVLIETNVIKTIKVKFLTKK